MDHDVARTGWGIPAAVAVAGALGQSMTMAPWAASFLAQAAWLPGAILMCGLLATPGARWAVVYGAALLGSAVACIGMERELLPHCVVLMGEFALVVVATWLLHPARDGRISPTGCDPVKFLLLCGVALPVAGGAWAHAATSQLGMSAMPMPESGDMLARSIGYLIVVPAFTGVIRLAQDAPRESPQHGWQSTILLVGALGIVVLWVSPFGTGDAFPVLLLAPVMLMLWSDHALGTAWTRLAWVPIWLGCLLLTSLGIGPLVHQIPGATLSHLQWWSVGTSVVLLLLTALRDQRGESSEALRDSGERLSQLARRAMNMQENERSRIARDLHDDVNQSLAAISIELSTLKRGSDATARDRIEGLQDRLLGVSDDIRRLSHELHPSMLRYTSLAASLEGLCASHSRDDLHVRCETDESFELTEPQKLDLFRIAQEALHNVEKHAGARQVRIELRRDRAGWGLLRVEDDGRGLPDDRADTPKTGLGMISMAERARSLRGRLDFGNGPRGGTRVDVRFPVPVPSVEVLRPIP
ncbi:Two-component sensor histidine kinase [Lysobacter dokdonensis DS-58]|uniref:Two-component sensor histidine kinase n=1 Tax=Lysobacter dokdonensis DS-58 TaxID=1300345 RepID=A0A0A2WGW4_9GAMM|nr:sensor histidine kinase [Lysobacter dokdonensis]KGQ19431.1 Two-component sensor histidine kinase [Lysobacter dokdonensis DS-58]